MTSPFTPGLPRGTGAAKSHRVGRATLLNGVGTTAYRALVDIECATCGGVIAPGDLFSRRTQRTPHHEPGALELTTTEPLCLICRPLRLEENADRPAPLGGEHHEGCHEG